MLRSSRKNVASVLSFLKGMVGNRATVCMRTRPELWVVVDSPEQ
jgi:hypothetical protein